MSVIQQAKRARRKSKLDPRYQGARKDAAVRARRQLEKVKAEQDRRMRKTKKG